MIKNNLSQFIIPSDVLKIINVLNANGYQAFVVGGCVRDSFLGRTPEDWDIATDALPGEVKALFSKTVDTGLKHGTVTVLFNGGSFEITTFRIDGLYSDNRRPDAVAFTSLLAEDLSRRDFTINAIAYHPSEGFIDPFEGIEDIKRSIIRTVEKPDKRFEEDALRMMRCIRFSAQLNFKIDAMTIKSLKKNSKLITKISNERISDELTKILLSDRVEVFELLKDVGLLQYIIPEFNKCFYFLQNNPHHIYDVAHHSLKAVSSIEKNKILRWTMLLHDIGKTITKTTDDKGIDHFYGHPAKSVEIADNILKRLKFDNNSKRAICRLIEFHDRDIEPTQRAVRKAVSLIGEDIFLDLLKVKISDKKSQNPEYLSSGLEKLDMIKSIYYKNKEGFQCTTLKDLAINGSDLLQLGVPKGKEIGKMLNWLLCEVIETPELNSKDKLIGLLKRKT